MVISVLWLIGLPVYIVIKANRWAQYEYSSCLNNLSQANADVRASGQEVPKGLEGPHDFCLEAASFVTASDFARALVDGSSGSARLWRLMLLPIAALWLLGGIGFATLRWIAKGFSNHKRTP